ncbi:MBL fold metallo-hydrolase [Georgenia sp. Z1491]|uniref:MBL fold metallo-hydrolase n=1 Tax=Georgenia sp. Z1491 TaxID=3416707 RepID=UPI003CF3D8BB
MRLTVIGCAGSMSGPDSAASAYLVQASGPGPDGTERVHSIVLDLGPGAMGAMLNHVDPADLDALVLSHLHADHMVDLIGMQVYRRWHPDGPLPALAVHGPEGTLGRTRDVGGDGPDEDYSDVLTFHALATGTPVRIGPMTVEVFDARHPVPAFGIRVTGPAEDGSGSVTLGYTGDTDSCPGQDEMARGLDLLLAEAAFQEGRDEARGIHLTGRRAGELAVTGGVGRLVLTHVQPWTDKATVVEEARGVYEGPVDLAAPGATWVL